VQLRNDALWRARFDFRWEDQQVARMSEATSGIVAL